MYCKRFTEFFCRIFLYKHFQLQNALKIKLTEVNNKMRLITSYSCDNCHTMAIYRSYKAARSDGWAVSKDYKHCYCPKCASNHRYGNATNMNHIGEKMLKNLRDLRKEVGLTQKEVAEKLNISQQTYSDYENCKTEPTIETLIAIANFFEVSTDYLLGLDSDESPKLFTPMSDGLSEKERAMLEAFRQLLPETQDFILRSAQSLHDKKSVT